MYYGNADAVAVSSGDATFVRYDIFDTLDGWSKGGSPSLSTTKVYNGTYSALINADQENMSTTPNGIGIYSIMYYDIGDTTMQHMFNHSIIVSGAGKTHYIGYLSNINSSAYVYRYDSTHYNTGISRSVGWHEFKIIMTGTQQKLYIDNTLVSTRPYDIGTENSNNLTFGEWWASSVGNGYYDQYIVREYVAGEPTISAGATEATPTTGYHIYVYPQGQIYQYDGSGINK